MPDFLVSTWNAVFAPEGLPKEIQAKLNLALSAALDDESTRQRLVKIGFIIPQVQRRNITPASKEMNADKVARPYRGFLAVTFHELEFIMTPFGPSKGAS